MELTPEGRRLIEDVAQRHGVSTDAVQALLYAVAAGNGTSAQFSHPELGGMGQWSQGGMIMVGDMFNQGAEGPGRRAVLRAGEPAARPGLGGPRLRASQSQSPRGPQGMQGQSQHRRHGVPASACSSRVRRQLVAGRSRLARASGAQNDVRYACFPSARRLAIQLGGRVTVYDTQDHQIGGFSQQQGLATRR